jgi:transcriptional regulator with XRE-family HTH domain
MDDAKDVMIIFGRKLKEIRIKKNISQEELAFRSGLHRTYISSIERGQRNISIVNIKKIADALDVDVSDLLS